MALAQGSGELIWWPYIIAKYGLTFLFLLLPACLLQFPVIYEIGRYTMLTGESIFQGFMRLNRFFALLLWILMTLSFLWFGAFAAAGGTSLAALTDLPAGWSPRGQTLFWAYLSMLAFLSAILLSKVLYRLVELFMWGVAIVTLVGLFWASAHPDALRVLPAFLTGLFIPQQPMPRRAPLDRGIRRMRPSSLPRLPLPGWEASGRSSTLTGSATRGSAWRVTWEGLPDRSPASRRRFRSQAIRLGKTAAWRTRRTGDDSLLSTSA